MLYVVTFMGNPRIFSSLKSAHNEDFIQLIVLFVLFFSSAISVSFNLGLVTFRLLSCTTSIGVMNLKSESFFESKIDLFLSTMYVVIRH
ncbi:Uncharacterised protein [Salmonella enterica subsp. arizonae]|nr:hypothetical protein [Salmonella enterica]VDY44828.1 Uncharacterised protein [Salmonella enterica subsp. arizonae]